jgi:hypothetical protein
MDAGLLSMPGALFVEPVNFGFSKSLSCQESFIDLEIGLFH